jgi:Probable transposase
MDWGVVNFATLSDGEVVGPCQPLKKFLPKLAKLHRRLARKRKFSKNWRKAKARITRLHTRVANIRKDLVHKVSNNISKSHVVVCVEDLQVQNMSKSAAGTKEKPGKRVAQKSGLNRSILDASPFEFAPSVRVQDAVERRSSGACASARYKPSLPRVGGRLRSCAGRESSGASKICLRPVRVLRQRRLGCCCKC